MNFTSPSVRGLSRRVLLSALAALPALIGPLRSTSASAQAPIRCRPGTTARPRQSITDFVARVTTQGGPDFVPADQRIATFDNDGTLWIEQPMYVQLAFILDRVKALAPQNPDWKTKQPFKAVLDGDMKALAASGEKGLVELMAVTHAGMTTDEFAKIVSDWLATRARSALQAALHRAGLSADAGGARLSARQRLQDLHRLGRRHRVHAAVDREGLRHSARAGGRLLDQDAVRDARRQAGPVPAAGDQFHRRQGRQAGRHQPAYRPPADRRVRQLRRRSRDAAMDDDGAAARASA